MTALLVQKSQACLIKSVARYDRGAAPDLLDGNPDYDAFETTLSRLRDAYEGLDGLEGDRRVHSRTP